MQTEVIEGRQLNSKLLTNQLNSKLLTITWLRSSLPKDTKVTDPFSRQLDMQYEAACKAMGTQCQGKTTGIKCTVANAVKQTMCSAQHFDSLSTC